MLAVLCAGQVYDPHNVTTTCLDALSMRRHVSAYEDENALHTACDVMSITLVG